MKPKIRVNLLPLYRCNLDCAVCLFKNEHSNPATLDLVWLERALTSIKLKYDIINIDISGGEITLLSDLYLAMLINLAKVFCKKVSVCTNFFQPKSGLINTCDIINVKYDFKNYPAFEKTIQNNILAATQSGKVINIKSLDVVTPDDVLPTINTLNMLKIKSWEIVPYHQTKANNIPFTDYSTFENKVQLYLPHFRKMKFAFQNKLQLDRTLPIDNYNVKNIYITPNNTFGVQTFDNANNFSLIEYKQIDAACKKLRELEICRDGICDKCTSKLQCMANKFLNLEYTGPSCSGFKDLIAHYNK